MKADAAAGTRTERALWIQKQEEKLGERIKMAKKYVDLSVTKGGPRKQLNCFIIMPFTQASFKDKEEVEHALNEAELKHIYEELFVKAVKSYNKNNISFLNVHRSNAQRGNFVKDIVGKLQDYDLVIADLTGSNPNVFYELGIRHTLKNGTIMITQNVSQLPSDLKNYIGIEYKYHKKSAEFSDYYSEFEKTLHSLIDDVLCDKDKIDNPVREFIGNRVIFRREDRIREIEGNIKMMSILKDRYSYIVGSFCCQKKGYMSLERSKDVVDSSLSQLTNAFLYKVVNSFRDMEVIDFLDHLLLSSELIKCNFGNSDVYDNVIFFSCNSGEYSLEELTEYYEDVCRSFCESYMVEYEKVKNDEPICMSFDSFVREWKKELKELTGE